MKKIIPLFLGFLLVTGSVIAGVVTGIVHLISLGFKSSFFIDWFEDKRPDKPTLQQLQEEYRLIPSNTQINGIVRPSNTQILKPKGK
jgi:hypothetical protein